MATELTDEDYGNIDAAMKCIDGRVGTGKERVYLAGLRAGYKRGIEDAAKCIENEPVSGIWELRRKWAAAIRKLSEPT